MFNLVFQGVNNIITYFVLNFMPLMILLALAAMMFTNRDVKDTDYKSFLCKHHFHARADCILNNEQLNGYKRVSLIFG